MKQKAEDILPSSEHLPDDLYRRLCYFVNNYCLRHDLLYQYGWGHLLLACYAAFPAHLTPDLLHKLRLNFRHYQQFLPLQKDGLKARKKTNREIITREIPLVAVSDLLLSNLLRETGFERFEMPEELRHYLLWLFQRSGVLVKKCEIFPLPPSTAAQVHSPETAKLNGLAEFLKYYADEHYTAPDPMTRSLREAQKWTAEAWQNPEKAASFLRERLSTATKPAELYHFSRLGNRLGVQYDLQLNVSQKKAPPEFEALRMYARGVSALYDGNVKQAIETLGGSDHLIASEISALPAPGAVRLPVPREVAQELLKQHPELLERRLDPRPREWDSLDARLRSSWPKAVLTIDDGDRLEIAQRLVKLEQSLQKSYQDTTLRLTDYFDIIAGSGMGAFMAAMAVWVKNAVGILSSIELQELGGINIASTSKGYSSWIHQYLEDQRFPNDTYRNGLMVAVERVSSNDVTMFNNLTSSSESNNTLLADLLSNAVSNDPNALLHSAYLLPTNNLNFITVDILIEHQSAFKWNITPDRFLLVSIQADPPPIQMEKSGDEKVQSEQQIRQQVRWIERHHLDLLNIHRMRVVNWGGESEIDWPEAWRVESLPEEVMASKISGLQNAQTLLLETVNGLIEENEIEKALDTLKDLDKQSGADIWHDLTLQYSNYRSAKKAQLEGRIDFNEFRRYEAQTRYLLTELMKTIPRKIALNAKIHSVSAFNFEISDSIRLEKLLGPKSSLMMVDWLEKARAAANAVCRVVCADGTLGTGFLAKDGYVFTNNHIISSAEVAKTARLEFIYEEGKAIAAYQIDPSDFITSPPNELDFARMKVIDRGDKPLSQWGFIEIDIESLPIVGEDIITIQYPKGDVKKFRSDEVIGQLNQYIFYSTATETGSSGLPVLNKDCKVIALHHAGKTMAEGGLIINAQGDRAGANRGILFRDIFAFIDVEKMETKNIDDSGLESFNLKAPPTAASSEQPQPSAAQGSPTVVPKFVVIYDNPDTAHCQMLNKHLNVLKVMKKIRVYSVHETLGLDPWGRAAAELADADYVLVLATPSLLNNGEVWSEMLNESKQKGIHMIQILVERADYKGTWLDQTDSLPSLGRAVSDYTNTDAAYADIVGELRKLLPK